MGQYEEKYHPIDEISSHVDLSPKACKIAFGIEAGLTTAFRAGQQTFGVFRISENQPSCFPSAPEEIISTSFLIVQFDEEFRVMKDCYKGLWEDELVVIGRDESSRFHLDTRVSRRHTSVKLSGGKVSVHDLGSANGTEDVFEDLRKIAERRLKKYEVKKREQDIAQKIRFAKQVELFELTRKPDNDNLLVDEVYISNHTSVRRFIVDSIKKGTLYGIGETEEFSENLKHIHLIANKDSVYSRVGQGRHSVHPGEFRKRDSVPFNRRLEEANEVAIISSKYGDPYANRFYETGTKKVILPGIPEKYSPYDITYESGEYIFFYPSGKAIPLYLSEINSLGIEITKEIDCEKGHRLQVLKLIARQYQYGAILHPFWQVNNSIFMNLANAEIKLLGYQGISHYNLDIAAQRMQPKNFVPYFVDTVLGKNSSF